MPKNQLPVERILVYFTGTHLSIIFRCPYNIHICLKRFSMSYNPRAPRLSPVGAAIGRLRLLKKPLSSRASAYNIDGAVKSLCRSEPARTLAWESPFLGGNCMDFRSKMSGDCHVGLRPPRNDSRFYSPLRNM